MNSFVKNKIEDVCEFIGGSQPPKSQFSDIELPNYIRLVQTRDFKTDAFITYIPKNSTSKFFGKSDIMIGRYGPPIFQIFRGKEGAYNVALLKAKPKKNILNDYLYYFLKQDSVFRYIDKLSARTGGQTGIDLVSLSKYPINLPDLFIQQKIASILSVLDNKIDLNNKINLELEQMSKMLYDYWFVQFDFPDQNGKPYKSLGGKMVYNEVLKREIPEGWSNEKIDDLGTIIGGSTPSKSVKDHFTAQEIPWITPKDLSDNIGKKFITRGQVDVTEKGKKEASLNLLPAGSVLMSSRAPVGYLAINKIECTTNQGFKSIVCNKEYPSEYVYYLLSRSMSLIEANATGSTFKEISGSVLKSINILKPSKEIIAEFIKVVKPIFVKQSNLEEQNHELVQLRDWLLPMLMNGQIKVVDKDQEDLQIMNIAAETNSEYEKQKPFTFNRKGQDDQRFEMWLSNQGLAARGDIDGGTLKEIFDAMDDEDK